MHDRSDEDLVAEFLSGNRVVFETLFHRYYKKVYNLCLRFCNLDRTLAEETAQETFLQVYRSLDRFQLKSTFYTWLYRVTFNTCSIAIKKAVKNRSSSLEGDLEFAISPSDQPAEKILKKEYHEAVIHIINELPEDQKHVMILGPVMGHSYLEISEITGESITVVKGRLFRARQNFRKKFDHYFSGESNFDSQKNTNQTGGSEDICHSMTDRSALRKNHS